MKENGPFIVLLTSNSSFAIDDGNTDDNGEYNEQEHRTNREL